MLLVGAGVLAMASVAASSAISALEKVLSFPGAAQSGETITSLTLFALCLRQFLRSCPM